MDKQNTGLWTLLLFFAGLLTLIVVGLLDYAQDQLQLYAVRTFAIHPVVRLGAISLAALLAAALFVVLAWLSFRKAATSRLAGLLLLLLGLPVALIPVWFGLPLVGGWYSFIMPYVSGGYLVLGGAFLTVLGLVMIFQPSRQN